MILRLNWDFFLLKWETLVCIAFGEVQRVLDPEYISTFYSNVNRYEYSVMYIVLRFVYETYLLN